MNRWTRSAPGKMEEDRGRMGIAAENEIMPMSASAMPLSTGLWRRYLMVLDEVTDRLQRIVGAFEAAGVEYALVGGQAVALWVATKDPSAVRTTKDVDILPAR